MLKIVGAFQKRAFYIEYCLKLGHCIRVHSVEFSWVFYYSDFYVKSIFRDSGSAKSAILTNLEALNFDFYEILHFFEDWYLPN